MARFDTVSFLSDYGTTDEFAGVITAVIRDLAPHVNVVDITHGIAPFDITAGALALARAVSYLPTGVVLAVVEPISTRPRVAIEVAGGVFVGPDNGLLAPAVAIAGGAQRAVTLTNTDYHLTQDGPLAAGRDIYAAAAAHLCNGVPLAELGDEIDPGLLLPGTIPLPRDDEGTLIADVLWVDRFGNIQLNLSGDDLAVLGTDELVITYDDPIAPNGHAVRRLRRVDAVADIAEGEVGLVLDSAGLMSIVINRRSAADEWGLAVGDQISIAISD